MFKGDRMEGFGRMVAADGRWMEGEWLGIGWREGEVKERSGEICWGV
jgi:hypothetical protein